MKEQKLGCGRQWVADEGHPYMQFSLGPKETKGCAERGVGVRTFTSLCPLQSPPPMPPLPPPFPHLSHYPNAVQKGEGVLPHPHHTATVLKVLGHLQQHLPTPFICSSGSNWSLQHSSSPFMIQKSLLREKDSKASHK